MTERAKANLPPEFIAQAARLLQGIQHQPEGRNAELAQETMNLNEAVMEAARELDFDDQPTDFLALLIALREAGDHKA